MLDMKHTRGFASDNNAPVHPLIMQALQAANQDHCLAYGSDPFSAKARRKIREFFGEQSEVFFVFTGTAANVLGLAAATRSFNSVICAETAHIQTDECGAPEKFTGCKIIPVATPDGKLTPGLIKQHLYGFGFEHHAQPGVISITQPTEVGTVYTPDEIKVIAALAHKYGLFLHMDGARLSNAAVSLGCTFHEMTTDAGVDVLSFGGAKNGLMFGEAVIFFNPALSGSVKYIRKQSMQLASKMRYISAQFLAYLENDLWKKMAINSNHMATLLAKEVEAIPGVTVTQKVQANGVFAIIPPSLIQKLQDEYFFYIWNENTSEVRWMCSWDTSEEDVKDFAGILKKLADKKN